MRNKKVVKRGIKKAMTKINSKLGLGVILLFVLGINQLFVSYSKN